MDDLLNKLGWKKVTALLIGACVLGFIYIVISMQQIGNSKSQQNVNKISNGNSTGGSGGTSNNQTLQTFSTPYYQISYPANFSVQPYQSSGNILSTLILSDVNSHDARIDILTYSMTDNSMSAISKPFEGIGFVKSTIPNGVVFTGRKTEEPKFFERIAIIEKGTYVMRLFLTYRGESKDSALEKAFDEIVASVR